MRRGEIRWYTFRLPDKRRPVLILTRNAVIDRLNEIIVAPATRTIRGLTSEVVLTVDDGMPVACALNFDHVSLAQRSRIGPVVCVLSESRWAEVRDALLIACGFGRSLNAISTHNLALVGLTYQPCGILRQQKPPAQETVSRCLYDFDVSRVITVTLFE